MYSAASVTHEISSLLPSIPESPTCYLDDFPTTSMLSPLFLSSDTHSFLHDQPPETVQEIHYVSDLHSYSPIIPTYSEDDYVITSLDGGSPDTSDTYSSKSSDLSSPESIPTSSSCTDYPDILATENTSVTSRLKSVLLSRKKAQTASSVQKAQGLVSSSQNYSSAENNKNVESRLRVDSQNNDKYTANSTLRFPPCFVCGGTASGLHYGVNSCEPCKGFFTRYLRKKEEYKCAKNNNCPITNRLRGNCSACRLKKCLVLGMSRKNSRLGRYSLSRRMETIMQVNEIERQSAESVLNHNSVDLNSSHACGNASGHNEYSNTKFKSARFDSNENADSKTSRMFGRWNLKAPSGFTHKLVKVLVDYMENIKPYGEDLVTDEQIMTKLQSHYESYMLKISLFGNLKTIPKEEYYDLLKGYGIEIDKRMVFLKQSADEMIDIIERYCNFAKQIPNFKSLSSRDQQNLLKSSRYDFFMILMHSGYLHENKVFLAHNGVAFHMEEVADKFFSRKLVINVCDMYHRLQNLKLSKEEKALLIAISLVFTDRCSLENPDLVQQIQFSLTHLLQKQLEKTCPSSAFRRFTKIIDCLTIMRDSSELFLKEYSQLCQDEMIIEEVPIMTELLFED